MKAAHHLIAYASAAMLIQTPITMALDTDKLTLRGSATAIYGNDSNVIIKHADINTNTDDFFLRLKAKGQAKYTFTKEHSASASLSFNDKNYREASLFDLRTLMFSSGYRYKTSLYTAGFDFRHISADLNGHSYLSLSQASPSLAFFLNRKNFLRLSYTHADKTIKNKPAKAASSNELGMDYYFFWKGLNDYFIGSFRFKQEGAKDAIFNYNSFQAKLGYKKRYRLLSYKTQSMLNIKYRLREYKDKPKPEINGFRSDQLYGIGFDNALNLLPGLKLLAAIHYSHNDSNLSGLNYNETIISSGLEYQF